MIDTKMMRFTFGHRDYELTHYPLCEQNHINCAILALCNELDAEREKNRWNNLSAEQKAIEAVEKKP